ncbi:MAG: phytanoyl-CoA dioxygenase family protein [Chitinophagales bacterium]
MKRMFLDDKEEQEVLENGFIVKPLLSKEDVQKCMDVFRKTDEGIEDGKYNTLDVDDYQNRLDVFNDLNDIFKDQITSQLNGYRHLGFNFAAKKALSKEKFPMHIDNNHCSREMYRGLNVWIPLVDVNKENGGLYIVPKTHKLPFTLNGIGMPFPYKRYKRLFLHKAKFVNMKAGDALFFDDRVVHGSMTNKKNEDRIAIITALVPKEAQFLLYVHYPELKPNEMELFRAEDDMFLNLKIGKRPEGHESLGIFKHYTPKISMFEVMKILK